MGLVIIVAVLLVGALAAIAVVHVVLSLIVLRTVPPLFGPGTRWLAILTLLAQGGALYLTIENTHFRGDMAYAAGAGVLFLMLYVAAMLLATIVCYPLLFLAFVPPTRKVSHFRNLFIFYALLASPWLFYEGQRWLRFGMFAANVDFYGRVTNIDDVPVPGATIEIRNCSWVDGPVTANESGVFNAVGNCRYAMAIASITEPGTRQSCQSRFATGPAADDGVAWFSTKHSDYYDPGEYDAGEPFPFRCVWEAPENLVHGQAYEEIAAGGETHTLSFHLEPSRRNRGYGWDEGYMTTEEGVHEGQLRLRVHPASADAAGDASGGIRVGVSAVDGGVQRAPDDNHYVNYAPENGYADEYSWIVAEGETGSARIVFVSNRGREYGYVDIRVRRLDRAESTASINVRYGVNMDGEREIVRHVFQPY